MLQLSSVTAGCFHTCWRVTQNMKHSRACAALVQYVSKHCWKHVFQVNEYVSAGWLIILRKDTTANLSPE